MYMAVILKMISQNEQILLSFPPDYAEKYIPIFFWVDIYVLCPPFTMNQINFKDKNNSAQAYSSVIRKTWNFYPI